MAQPVCHQQPIACTPAHKHAVRQAAHEAITCCQTSRTAIQKSCHTMSAYRYQLAVQQVLHLPKITTHLCIC
jgi:hypothetical protein